VGAGPATPPAWPAWVQRGLNGNIDTEVRLR
jgi:hypothetical protein